MLCGSSCHHGDPMPPPQSQPSDCHSRRRCGRLPWIYPPRSCDSKVSLSESMTASLWSICLQYLDGVFSTTKIGSISFFWRCIGSISHRRRKLEHFLILKVWNCQTDFHLFHAKYCKNEQDQWLLMHLCYEHYILHLKGSALMKEKMHNLPERTTGRRNVHSCESTDALGSSSLTNLQDVLN